MSLSLSAKTIVRPSLHEELVERVQDLIIQGELPPRSKVPEKELCAQFGVSRTPMREALKVLAVGGLIVLEPNRGAWVREITLEELEEVFPVLGALEALAGELACQNITAEDIDAVKAVHAEMEQQYKDRNRQEYFKANQRIHEIILTASGNATLTEQHRSLSMRLRRARFLANMEEDRWQQAVDEHGHILDALQRRAGSELGELLKQHLENKLDTIRHWVNTQNTAEPQI